MEYKIKKGDKFICLEDYEMEDERVSYTKGILYRSDLDGRITDNEFDVMHEMEGAKDLTTKIENHSGIIQSYDVEESFWNGTAVKVKMLIPEKLAYLFIQFVKS